MPEEASPILDNPAESSAEKGVIPEPVLSIGCIVHFVEPDGSENGIHRAAVVSMDYDGKKMVLSVAQPCRMPFVLVAKTPHDEDKKAPGTWHFPERV